VSPGLAPISASVWCLIYVGWGEPAFEGVRLSIYIFIYVYINIYIDHDTSKSLLWNFELEGSLCRPDTCDIRAIEVKAPLLL